MSSSLRVLDEAPIPDLWASAVERSVRLDDVTGRPVRPIRRGSKLLLAAATCLLLGAAMVIALGGSERATISIPSSNMEPTLPQGGSVEVDFAAYEQDLPSRGDVIVFRHPSAPDVFFIDRVIGLPGETVDLRNGVVTIDGQVLHEPYAIIDDSSGQWVVPDGRVFVMGDNRRTSKDSRNGLGNISIEDVVGQALVGSDPVDEPLPPPAGAVRPGEHVATP